MALGTFDRDRAVRALGEGSFDLLVIGGGVTGAGVALDAASRGLRTALVERDDFASGTSSKSSKLVHGGLRYLQNGDVRLVYEALRERQRLLRNAPHLVSPLPFLIPIMGKGGVINPKIARALGSAMWMYDLTGGARIGKLHKRLSTEEALEHMPTLRADRVGSAYLYYDAAADDARLTLTLARTAALDHGAVVVNHAGVVELTKDAHGHASGAIVDVAGGERRRSPRPGGRERGRGVVRHPSCTRRARRPGLDPTRQGHPHHRAVGAGPQRHRRGRARPGRQALGVRRAVAAPGRRDVRTHLRRYDRHRLRRSPRRPTLHQRRHRLPAPGCQRRHGRPQRWRPDRGRREGYLGRAAAARQGCDQRPHRRSVAAPPRH